MTVKNEITPVEIDGKDHCVGDDRRLSVESHFVSTRLVHLKWGKLDLLVSAADLQAAITNACNHPR